MEEKEEELICRILNNEPRAANQFYHHFAPRLKNFISQKIDDPKDVEDVLQDTFVAAFDSLPTFSSKSSLFSWLCGIARHEIADFYRKKKIKTILFSRFPFLENLASQALGPEELYEEEELKRRIKAALESLGEGYQKILRLKYCQGLTVAEIAEQLNESFKAVESRLFRARKAFRKAFSFGSY